MPHAPRGALIVAMAALFFSLLACSASTGASTPGTTPTVAAPTCATLLPGSASASGGPDFGDIPFPTGAVSTPLTGFSSGTGRYTISLFKVCAPNTSASAVKSFYASQLITAGWAQDPTLPFDGSYQQACGDPYCWKKGANPIAQRLIGLEQVTDAGNSLVTFQWRVFVPPAGGTCNAADFPTTGFFVKTNGGPSTDFQFPPVTYYVSLGGAAGSRPNIVCSAGNPSSILAFMKNSISKSKWKILSTSSTVITAELPVSPPNGFCYQLDVIVNGHAGYPGEWDYVWYVPAAACV
jgi:hypothetical protein